MDPEYVKQITEVVSMPMKPDNNEFDSYEYENVYLHTDILKSTMEDLKTLHIREDDVFVVSFPKTGTTWTQEIVSAVLHDGDIERVNQLHTMIRVPFLEMSFGIDIENSPKTHKIIELMNSPRLIKSHLPGQLLPPQVWEKKAKIIYVIRNPKDMIVSFFKFGKMLSPRKNIDLDITFEKCMDGTIPYGKWWEHYLYFWQRRNEDHVLFIRFEDMKKDLRGTVKRISEFLEKSFSDEILDAITDHCTFENMKKNPMTNPDTLLKATMDINEGQSFMRKGTVGGWKGELSKSQCDALETLCKEYFDGTGLSFS
ncbi:amine sulfotransferase-like [Asterias amurensis]|uniref:amine sulfotransferase-like n=1 Tax=Asterias amurensis TaxID=7602 RepID=UPI003AB3B573